MPSLRVVKAPVAEPLTLQIVKNALRVTTANDDALIGIYMQASRESVESGTGRSLVNKGYLQSHDRFPHRHDWTDRGTGYWYAAPRYARKWGDERQAIKLLRCPLVQVEKITYMGTDSLSHDLFPAPELWQASTEYVMGDQVQDSNGNLQEVTAVADLDEDDTAESDAGVPAWSATLNVTTTDNDLTWTCKQIPAPAGDFLVDRDSEPPRLLPLFSQVWPLTLRVPNAVQIFFEAGYGDSADAAPACAKVVMLQLIGNWYENREAVSPDHLEKIPHHLDDLLWNIRVMDLAPTR